MQSNTNFNIEKYLDYVCDDPEFNYTDDEIDLITIHIFEDGVNKVENVKVIKNCSYMEEESNIVHYLTLDGTHIQSLQMDQTYNVCMHKKFKEFIENDIIVPKNIVKNLLIKLNEGKHYIKILYNEIPELTKNYIRDKAIYNLINRNTRLEEENMFLIDLAKKLGKEN